jgi:hypothetical protein
MRNLQNQHDGIHMHKNIRIFLMGVLWALLVPVGMAEGNAADDPPTVKEEKGNEAVSENLVVQFFSDADLQAETRTQLREIRRALDDALTLPVSQWRARRYADYTMTANRWTFGKLISAYFLSSAPIDPKSEKFYEDCKKPEAAAVLQGRLAEVEQAIPHGAGE